MERHEKIEKMKALLGLSEQDDALIEFAIDDAEEIIKNYCNIPEIPDRLDYTSIRMAIDIFRNESIGHESAEGRVLSVSEGDTSVSYSYAEAGEEYKGSVLKDYIPTLNKFRRLVFR